MSQAGARDRAAAPDLKIAYVTGTDGQRMLNAAILVDSFSQHMPDQVLHLCDFGMEAAEVRFWGSLGALRPRPGHLAADLHPWKYKAAFCEFIEVSDYDAVVWLDADMLLLGPIDAAVSRLVAAMQQDGSSVAVTWDGARTSVSETMDGFAAGGKDISAFRRLLERYGRDGKQTYWNTGFLVIRDYAFANDWRRETMQQQDWVLFEQNTFNALAGRPETPIHELDPAAWNVHGDLLADVDIAGNGRTPLVLHTTSAEQRHHIENRIAYPIGDKVLPGWFKLFARDDLRDLQQHHLLQFLQNNLPALAESGLLVDGSDA